MGEVRTFIKEKNEGFEDVEAIIKGGKFEFNDGFEKNLIFVLKKKKRGLNFLFKSALAASMVIIFMLFSILDYQKEDKLQQSLSSQINLQQTLLYFDPEEPPIDALLKKVEADFNKDKEIITIFEEFFGGEDEENLS